MYCNTLTTRGAGGEEGKEEAYGHECLVYLPSIGWCLLAGGFLAGKYQPGTGGEGRLNGPNPFSGGFSKFTDRNWQILAALRDVAGQLERFPSWCTFRSGRFFSGPAGLPAERARNNRRSAQLTSNRPDR